ncbi:MAG: T9SS type A sorting domain-containing protein, partial [bacterium]|nr:T9SS type A sorting domain-containing protein [bacterium]
RLAVTSTANTYSDEIIIEFGNISDQNGAEKLFSMDVAAPSLYSTKLNKNWSINHLTTVAEHSIVPVGFKAGADGIYTINLDGSEWFNYVILEDLKTGIQKNMSTNSNYQFIADTSDNPNRFLLHFSPLGVSEASKATPKIYYNNQNINIFNPWTGKTIAQIYDVNGSLIKTFDVRYGEKDYNFNPSRGIYIVRMINENQIYKRKIVTF